MKKIISGLKSTSMLMFFVLTSSTLVSAKELRNAPEAPTLTSVMIAPTCAGSSTTVTLTGLQPNVYATASVKIGTNPETFESGTALPDGTFTFSTGNLGLGVNGVVLEITKIENEFFQSTNFTGKTATFVVKALPTLGSVSIAPTCDGSSTMVTLTGLVAYSTSTATYTVDNGLEMTQTGTADASGTFSFETNNLGLVVDGDVLEVTKITNDIGCETNFTGKTAMFSVTAKPTLSTVTAAPVCPGNFTYVVLSGLLANTTATATYKIGTNNVIYTQAGTSDANGMFSFPTNTLGLGVNGIVIEITKITSANGCFTQFTNKKVTLSVAKSNCNNNGPVAAKSAVDELTIYPNPAKDVLNIGGATKNLTVEILNLQGQKVLTSTESQINISSLASGAYLVRIQDAENNVVIKRIVKN